MIRLHRVPPTRFTLVCTFLLVVLLVAVSGCIDQFQPDQYIPTTADDLSTSTSSPTPVLDFSCIPQSEVQVARVTKIIDGDTIWVKIDGKSYKVRYIGMNAPEVGQPGADDATALNSKLTSGKTVYLYKDISETDKYGRLLRYVIADGKFVDYELVKAGFAKAGTWKPDTACDSFLRNAESQ
jgi:micrococcal nuclease